MRTQPRKTAASAELRIGISGWTYPPWRGGTFYPEGWAQKRELEYAARQVNSIEINGTFYSLQRPESFRAWYEATPAGFVFSVKGGRFITHLKRLTNVETPLANFFASGVMRLAEKLGPRHHSTPNNRRPPARPLHTRIAERALASLWQRRLRLATDQSPFHPPSGIG